VLLGIATIRAQALPRGWGTLLLILGFLGLGRAYNSLGQLRNLHRYTRVAFPRSNPPPQASVSCLLVKWPVALFGASLAPPLRGSLLTSLREYLPRSRRLDGNDGGNGVLPENPDGLLPYRPLFLAHPNVHFSRHLLPSDLCIRTFSQGEKVKNVLAMVTGVAHAQKEGFDRPEV
jgi:hypothetical protein